MQNSNETIGNRTRDLPACSAVPQSTAPPSAPPTYYKEQNILAVKRHDPTYQHVANFLEL